MNFSKEQIDAFRAINVTERDNAWKIERKKLVRQRFLVAVGDLFASLPALEILYVEDHFLELMVRSHADSQFVLSSRLPVPKGTPEDPNSTLARTVLEFFAGLSGTIGADTQTRDTLAQMWGDIRTLSRQEFLDVVPYLFDGVTNITPELRETIRVEKKAQSLGQSLPDATPPVRGPRF